MTDEKPADHVDESAPARLTIGRIVAPHGVRGEFRMYIYTHFPERIPEISRIYLGDESTPRSLTRARLQGNVAILRIEGIGNREAADALRNVLVKIDRSDAAPLDENEHFHFELIGLTAVDESGVELGSVVEIIETGANDVYVIKDSEGAELLIPALLDVVPEIDLESGKMVVRPPRYSDEA
jgi:16S rRNA processing protein RimM